MITKNHFFVFNSFILIVIESFVLFIDFILAFFIFSFFIPEKLFLNLYSFLKDFKNFFINFVPLVNGSSIMIEKNFYNIAFLSFIRIGSLFVFIKKCVLGKGGSSICIKYQNYLHIL